MRAKGVLGAFAALLLALSLGCSQNKASVADVKDHVSKALANADFKNITVDVNNEKELVTLKGDVKTQQEKERAEQIAKESADGYIVSNEIGVRPEGLESKAAKI